MLHKHTCVLVVVGTAVLLLQPSSAWAQAVGPDLVIAMSHHGDFTVGVNGVETIVVSNIGGTASSGVITVTDQLQPSPGSLEFVSATGTGWSCSYNIGFPNEFVFCLSSNVIAPGGSAFPITLTVRPGYSGTVTNYACFEGFAGCTSDVIIVVAAVPTVPEWAMIALTALLALAGFVAIRRRAT
jgi:hypothetical protein